MKPECSVMRVIAAVMFLAAISPGVTVASDPVTEDPSGFDSAFPPAMRELIIESHGARMSALAYIPAGEGPHPSVILLHGYPGNEKNLDLAQAIRRAGHTVLFFHYRGAWGSEGRFSLTGAEEDVVSAIDFLRETSMAAGLRADGNAVALVGHSMGGHMALSGLAADPSVSCAVSLDGANMGVLSTLDAQAMNGLQAYTDTLFMLDGWDGTALAHELARSGAALDLVARMPRIGARPILFVLAGSEAISRDLHVDPVTRALTEAGNDNWRVDVISDDHSFSASRLELARRVVTFLQEKCFQ
jgi:pimeloyl-ACP methyl ester carboxylesterase